MSSKLDSMTAASADRFRTVLQAQRTESVQQGTQAPVVRETRTDVD